MLNFIIRKIREKSFLHQFGLYIIKVSQTIFSVSMITFIVYFLLEQLKVGLISNYFDLNILPVLAIISGLFVVLFGEKPRRLKAEYHKKRQTTLIVILTLIISALIFQSLQNFAEMRYFITLAAVILSAIILSLFIRYDDD